MYLCLFVYLPIYLFFFSQHSCLGAKNQLLLSLFVPSEKPLQLSCKHRVPGSSILLANIREERDGDGGGRGDTHHFPLPLAPSFVSTQVGHAVPVPAGSPSRGGDVTVYVQDTNQPSLLIPFYSVLVSISVFMALSTVFHFIEFSRQLSVFSLGSSGLLSALLVLSTICLLVKVSFSPDIIPSG